VRSAVPGLASTPPDASISALTQNIDGHRAIVKKFLFLWAEFMEMAPVCQHKLEPTTKCLNVDPLLIMITKTFDGWSDESYKYTCCGRGCRQAGRFAEGTGHAPDYESIIE
jgi:hypothetical protein